MSENLPSRPEKGQGRSESIIFNTQAVSSEELLAKQVHPAAVSQIGPYSLIKQLGSGGMGDVWIAEQTEPVKRTVALKLIRAGLGSKEIIARFESERQTLALMNHPNIARILDAGTVNQGLQSNSVDDRTLVTDGKNKTAIDAASGHDAPLALSITGQPYFVMELVDGLPLTEYCDKNQLSIEERLKLFIDICGGVQHAHQKGIIHRDLKPGNILVTELDGVVIPKIIDFGLAKVIDNAQRLTDQSLFTGIGQILGTLKYMSPEQASLDNRDIDTRTDVYSLGVILYELLTGSTPLDSSSIKEGTLLNVLEAIRQQDPVRPSNRLSSSNDQQLSEITGRRKTDTVRLSRILRGDLDWIVMKALEKDRSRRYETASGFAADIRRYLDSEPVVARPPSLNYRIRKFVRKNRAIVGIASVLGMLVLGGIIGTSYGMIRAVHSERHALDSLRQSEDNLRYAIRGNEILSSVFRNLDPRAEFETVAEIRNALRNNLGEAVQELNATVIDDPLKLAEMQDLLAVALLGLGQWDEALGLYRQSLEIRLDKLGSDHEETLVSQNNLAEAYSTAESLNDALPLLQDVVSKMTSVLGRQNPNTLTSMGNLAECLGGLGKHTQAIEILEDCLADIEDHFGKGHSITLVSKNNLAHNYRAIGEFDKAHSLMHQTLELMKSNLGASHPDTLVAMNNLAGCYYAIGDFTNAVPLYQDALEQTRLKMGADHHTTLVAMNNLAAAYQALGNMEFALPLYEESHRRFLSTLGPKHTRTQVSMGSLATAYLALSKFDKALPLLEDSLKLKVETFGQSHTSTILTMNNLAAAYHRSGRAIDAVPLAERAAELLASLGFQHENATTIVRSTITILDSAEQFEQADSWRTRWLDHLKNKHGQTSAELAGELAAWGLQLLLRHDTKKAENVLRQCLEIREQIQPELWSTPNTRSMLGGALLEQGKFAEAESLLIEGYQGLREVEATLPPQANTRIPEALDRLIELYSPYNLDKPEERKKYASLRAAYHE